MQFKVYPLLKGHVALWVNPRPRTPLGLLQRGGLPSARDAGSPGNLPEICGLVRFEAEAFEFRC